MRSVQRSSHAKEKRERIKSGNTVAARQVVCLYVCVFIYEANVRGEQDEAGCRKNDWIPKRRSATPTNHNILVQVRTERNHCVLFAGNAQRELDAL